MPRADAGVPERAPFVWSRATALGTVGLGSAVGSHLLGGGLLPPAPVLAVLLAASVLLSAQFLLSWASTPRLVALVVAAQTGGHLVLSSLAGHAGDGRVSTSAVPAVPTGTGPRTGNLHDVYVATVPTGSGAPASASGGGFWAHQWEHLTEQGPLMVAAHALGAVALGVFLAHGERALRALLGLARAGVDVVLASLVVPVLVRPDALRHTLVGAVLVARPGVLALRAHPRRGPPVVLAT